MLKTHKVLHYTFDDETTVTDSCVNCYHDPSLEDQMLAREVPQNVAVRDATLSII